MTRYYLPLVETFADEGFSQIFSETALVNAYLQVERALAQAEADLGVIPIEAADAISAEVVIDKIDLAQLRDGTRNVGYPILPLLEQLSDRCSPFVGAYIHWGATTQDIMDTGLVLLMSKAVLQIKAIIDHLLTQLLHLATSNRSTVMPARTHAQLAVPTTLGAKVAVWIDELCRHQERLDGAGRRSLRVQLFGAAGTAAALGARSREIRHRLAQLLSLDVTDVPWHTARDGIAELGFVLAAIAATCGKIAREVIDLSRNEIGELSEGVGDHRGASSTMPQKANPILSEVVVGMSSLARHQLGALLDAMQAGHERSAGEWQIEWDAVPSIFVLAHGSLTNTVAMIADLMVFPERMMKNLDEDGGTIMAEAAMIALAPALGRREAHRLIYAACRDVRVEETSLARALSKRLEEARVPGSIDLDIVLDPRRYLGEAHAIVDAAVARVNQRMVSP